MFLLSVLAANAQDYSDTAYLKKRMERMDHILNILREFRIQVYIQPEWQHAQNDGIASVEGGNFPTVSSNRFIIRRGRFKLGWQHEVVNKHGDTIKVGEFAFQFDATEKGFNALKDMYRPHYRSMDWLVKPSGGYNCSSVWLGISRSAGNL